MKIYTYKKCGTCQKAVKWLKAHDIGFEEIPIRETPPSLADLKSMLASYQGNINKLFNTSGVDYRSGNYKHKVLELTDDELFQELNGNGNLVKRPFVISEKGNVVGFKEADWEQIFK